MPHQHLTANALLNPNCLGLLVAVGVLQQTGIGCSAASKPTGPVRCILSTSSTTSSTPKANLLRKKSYISVFACNTCSCTLRKASKPSARKPKAPPFWLAALLAVAAAVAAASVTLSSAKTYRFWAACIKLATCSRQQGAAHRLSGQGTPQALLGSGACKHQHVPSYLGPG